MYMDKKFIIVKDKPTADKLSAAGFILLSQIGGTYTFKNEQNNFIGSSKRVGDQRCNGGFF